MTKFERIQKWLYDYWGFTLRRNDQNSRGWYSSEWKTGYCVSGNLRGHFWYRFNSLAEIERSWMMKDYNR